MAHVTPFKKLSVSFDPIKLNDDLSQLCADNWVDHINKNDYDGDWQVLPLRCQQQYLSQHPILQSFSIEADHDWVNLTYLQYCSEILQVLNYFQCGIKSVRLMKLHAGGTIKPHRDKGLAIEYGEARFHVPVCGTDGVIFLIDNKPVPMMAGELWYVNADMEHSVVNRGEKERVNLVIDCQVNDWLIKEINAIQ